MALRSSQDIIYALSSGALPSAIALVRVSGSGCLGLLDTCFRGTPLDPKLRRQVLVGKLYTAEGPLDEVVVTVFQGPHSFTREDTLEISCHGSRFIVAQLMHTLSQLGARPAGPGEFTQRAFLHGGLDLTQAEAVADLIAADSHVAHCTALRQLQGGFSKDLAILRQRLIHLGAMLSLELDFAEEDVTFASRKELVQLVQEAIAHIQQLTSSLELGQAIRKGFAVVLAGEPNVGKSTLLNAFLQEERAIVSALAGTTRDVVEGEVILGGITCRIIDTAGLRPTQDILEELGIAKTQDQLQKAGLVLFLLEASTAVQTPTTEASLLGDLQAPIVYVASKCDQVPAAVVDKIQEMGYMPISQNNAQQLAALQARIVAHIGLDALGDNAIPINARHYHSLHKALEALEEVLAGLQKERSSDLVSSSLHVALYHLGEITGEVSTEDILGHIFKNFCIGK